MARGQQPESSLRDIYHLLFRHRYKVAIFSVSVMAAVVLYTLLSPRVYRSEGELFVRLGRENVTVDPVATLGHEPAVAIPASRENEINSIVEIVRNRVLLEHVVDAVTPAVILGRPERASSARSSAPIQVNASVGTPQPLPWSARLDDRERAVLHLSRELGVEPIRKSNILRVAYETYSPEVAQAVVVKVIELFLDQHIQLNRTQGAQDFLAQQTDRLRTDLMQAEQQMCALQNQTGLPLPELRQQLIVTRVSKLEDDLFDAAAALRATEAEINALRAKLNDLSPTQVIAETAGFGDMGTDFMRQQLYALRLQEHQRDSMFTEAHPRLQEIRRQTPKAQKVLEQEPPSRQQVTTGPNRSYEEAQLAMLRQLPVQASLQAKCQSLRSQLAAAQAELKTLNDNTLQIARLKRDIELQETHYRKYAMTLEQSRMDQSLGNRKISNISIVQPGSYSPKPIRPRKLFNLVLGFLVATFGGFGVALAAEYFDHSFKSDDDVEKMLELPMLVSIPWLDPGHLLVDGKEEPQKPCFS